MDFHQIIISIPYEWYILSIIVLKYLTDGIQLKFQFDQ